MMQIAELAQRIVVLHRSLGYLHLELPPEICGETAVDAIEAGMKTLDGLSSAAVDRGWKRISIRFDAQILSTPRSPAICSACCPACRLAKRRLPSLKPPRPST